MRADGWAVQDGRRNASWYGFTPGLRSAITAVGAGFAAAYAGTLARTSASTATTLRNIRSPGRLATARLAVVVLEVDAGVRHQLLQLVLALDVADGAAARAHDEGV